MWDLFLVSSVKQNRVLHLMSKIPSFKDTILETKYSLLGVGLRCRVCLSSFLPFTFQIAEVLKDGSGDEGSVWHPELLLPPRGVLRLDHKQQRRRRVVRRRRLRGGQGGNSIGFLARNAASISVQNARDTV